MRQRLRGPALRAERAAACRRARHSADCQKERIAHLQSGTQALDRVEQLCVAVQEQEAMEELRALAQHQLAVRPSGVLGSLTQETLNAF